MCLVLVQRFRSSWSQLNSFQAWGEAAYLDRSMWLPIDKGRWPRSQCVLWRLYLIEIYAHRETYKYNRYINTRLFLLLVCI